MLFRDRFQNTYLCFFLEGFFAFSNTINLAGLNHLLNDNYSSRYWPTDKTRGPYHDNFPFDLVSCFPAIHGFPFTSGDVMKGYGFVKLFWTHHIVASAPSWFIWLCCFLLLNAISPNNKKTYSGFPATRLRILMASIIFTSLATYCATALHIWYHASHFNRSNPVELDVFTQSFVVEPYVLAAKLDVLSSAEHHFHHHFHYSAQTTRNVSYLFEHVRTSATNKCGHSRRAGFTMINSEAPILNVIFPDWTDSAAQFFRSAPSTWATILHSWTLFFPCFGMYMGSLFWSLLPTLLLGQAIIVFDAFFHTYGCDPSVHIFYEEIARFREQYFSGDLPPNEAVHINLYRDDYLWPVNYSVSEEWLTNGFRSMARS